MMSNENNKSVEQMVQELEAIMAAKKAEVTETFKGMLTDAINDMFVFVRTSIDVKVDLERGVREGSEDATEYGYDDLAKIISIMTSHVIQAAATFAAYTKDEVKLSDERTMYDYGALKLKDRPMYLASDYGDRLQMFRELAAAFEDAPAGFGIEKYVLDDAVTTLEHGLDAVIALAGDVA